MVTVNAQSVEDFADRTVYRFPAGIYTQALTNWAGALQDGLKTLVNPNTINSYSIPPSGINYKFYKISLSIWAYALVTENVGVNGVVSVEFGFSKVSIPSLNYDGKSLQTEFYERKTENFVASPQLRFINIGNVLLSPALPISNLQYTGLSGLAFNIGAGTTQLQAYIEPVVTAYKK